MVSLDHNELTHCGLLMPYGDKDLVNIDSGNGLWPDDHKPLPEPMFNSHYWGSFCCIHLRAVSQQVHYSDVIMSMMVSLITSYSIVYSTICSGADQRKHHSSVTTGLCEVKSLKTGEFPAQRASNEENIFIWWSHHGPSYSSVLCVWKCVRKYLQNGSHFFSSFNVVNSQNIL